MQDCKLNILSTIPDNHSCSQAFVGAVLLTSSVSNEENSVLVNINNAYINKVIKIVTRFYPDIEISSWDDFLLLSGSMQELKQDCAINEQNLHNIDLITALKGLFITCGKLYYNQDSSKNSNGYLLEFVLRKEIDAKLTQRILKEFGFNFRIFRRKSYFLLYTKNSNVICDLLVILGAGISALEIQNNLAMREIRNNANRQNNCFEGNLDKTLSASSEQLKAINYIIENHSIDYFDDNLKQVALARIANPDVSLNDLKTILNNNISRAGIKYRLDKIIQMYKDLIGE